MSLVCGLGDASVPSARLPIPSNPQTICKTHQQLQRDARALALPARDAAEVDVPDALVCAARQRELLQHPDMGFVCICDVMRGGAGGGCRDCVQWMCVLVRGLCFVCVHINNVEHPQINQTT